MSAILCDDLRQGIGPLFTCTEQDRYVRVRTPFYYPDGDVIDVFVRRDDGAVTVTDLGETTRWLRMQTVAPRRSPKQSQLIADACLTHGIEFYKGQLLLRVQPGETLGTAVMRLAQACLRISDLWFTFRTRAIESVTDEIADFLDEKSISYERNERLPGRSGRVWRPDFHARTAQRSSLVFVLSTGSRPAARRISEHVVAAWHDLSHLQVGPSALQFVSLFDDTADVWSEEDFNLVGDLSEVTRWSDPKGFANQLEAA